MPVASTPPASSWTIYKATSGAHYAIGFVDGHLHAYMITVPKRWQQSCDVALVPEGLRESADPAIQEALKAVDALNVAVRGLTRQEGACGSMHTASRWSGYVKDALEQTLYRPWALRAPDDGATQSENSYGDYSRILEQLKLWSLGGLSEYEAFTAYESQFAQTRKELGRFYSKKYGWSSNTSDAMANDALRFAVSRGMGFYMYAPFGAPGEVELRKAILEHRPMRDIQATQADAPTMTRVLDAAVQYPEALRHLLAHGANPNAGNEFGKTPLMYAAQYNQLEATKILLAQGADPNAATTWPTDTCSYVLSTARMTPLHYAARYASSSVIRLLVANGALTFSKTEKERSDGEYPVDWLRRYAGSATQEQNANVADADIPKLAELLRVPSEKELATIATDLTKRAEADYAAGNAEKSYRELVAALSAQPDGERALRDLPLVALRSGRLGPSLEAADTVLAKVKNPDSQASAWFNKGLACEQNGPRSLSYNGRYYCMGDSVRPFLQAWKLGHSEARKNKLRTLFQGGLARTCSIDRKGAAAQLYRFEFATAGTDEDHRQVQRIYVYHPNAQAVDAASIKWTVRMVDPADKASKPTTIVPSIVERYELGEFAVTELKSDFMAQGSVSIGDQTCVPYK